ncbi:MAG: CAP domain-containing protein [Lachnospiraceae bacterium]|nr:CAP domain-containing protein [Lachnospiraceae bacterium]
MKKKAISLLLSVTMVVSSLGTCVYAAEPEAAITTQNDAETAELPQQDYLHVAEETVTTEDAEAAEDTVKPENAENNAAAEDTVKSEVAEEAAETGAFSEEELSAERYDVNSQDAEAGYLGYEDAPYTRETAPAVAYANSITSGPLMKVKGITANEYSFEILGYVNEARTSMGLSPLNMDESLLRAANQRAAELSVYYSHTRPNGESCFTVDEMVYGENIAAGYRSAAAVFNGWMNSEGHRANILGEDYDSIGIGCYYSNGCWYWVQVFGFWTLNAMDPDGSYGIENSSYIVSTGDRQFDFAMPDSGTIEAGIEYRIEINLYNETLSSYYSILPEPDSFTWASSDPAIVEVNDGIVLGKKAGTATVTATYGSQTLSCVVTVEGEIEVEPEPVVILKQPETVTAKKGDTVSFHVKATGAADYQWQYSKDGNKWVNSTTATAKSDSITIKLSSSNCTNRYRCLVTGEDGTVLCSEVAYIDLIPGVEITAQPVSVTAKMGQNVSYIVAADNVVSYQWIYSKDGTNWNKSGATGATTDTLSIRVSNSNMSNIYKCKMMGTDGNIKYSAVVGAVVVTEQPKNSSAAAGTTASFSITAANAATYQWQYSRDNGASWYRSSAAGATTPTVSFKVNSTNRSNIYRCKLTTANGITAYSDTAAFAEGLKILSQPGNVSVEIGEKAAFTVVAEHAVSYQWQYSKDGKTWYKSGAAGNATPTVQITVSASNKSNVYRCKITGTDGSVQYSAVAGVK